jgi:hypothetical protein
LKIGNGQSGKFSNFQKIQGFNENLEKGKNIEEKNRGKKVTGQTFFLMA